LLLKIKPEWCYHMKIKTIAKSAIALGFVGLSSLAIAQPTVYGKANVSLNKNDAEDAAGATTQDNWTLNSNASRLGVKGDMELEDGLTAIYKLEYEVAIDDGIAQTKTADTGGGTDEVDISSTFKQRNIYVGLEGDFGQVIAGNFDTPVKTAQGKIDRFNDLSLGDIKNVLNGENRVKNIIQYTTPDMSGFEAQLAFIPGEASGAPGDDETNGPADGTSLSITYKAEDFWVAVAADSEVDDYDVTRLAAEYSFGKTKLGAIIQNDEEITGAEENSGFVVSAQHTIDKWVLKGQYSSNTEDLADVDTTLVSLGADYKLSKNAKLYGYLSQGEKADAEMSTFGVGTEVKF